MPTKSSCPVHAHSHNHSHTHAHLAPVQKDIPSEFPSCGMATGAAMTFIDQLQARLPPTTFDQILAILNTYFQDVRPLEQVNDEVRALLVSQEAGGEQRNEDLVRGFEKFLPLEVMEVAEGSVQAEGQAGEQRVVEVVDDDEEESAKVDGKRD